MIYLVSVDVRRNSFGEEVGAHGSSLEVKVQRGRVLIGHCERREKRRRTAVVKPRNLGDVA